MRTLLLQAALVAALLAAPCTGSAQSNRGNRGQPDWTLPADARFWRNSPPLTLESLDGKGIVFYFFEEECRECAERWPALLRMAEQYAGDPVLFIAVNSGTDPRTLQRYLARHRISWPVIHDADRSLENAMGVVKLTPEGQVYDVKYRSGEGAFGEGKEADFDATAQMALKGAEWRVDPEGIPPRLRPAWRAIELGDFAVAARDVTRGLDSKDEPLKTAAARLHEAVVEELTDTATRVEEALQEGDDWAAYKQIESMVARFDGYDLTKPAEEKFKELAKSEGVVRQVKAARLFDKAVATGSKGTAAAVSRARRQLEQIVNSWSDTEAAEKAQELLAGLGAG